MMTNAVSGAIGVLLVDRLANYSDLAFLNQVSTELLITNVTYPDIARGILRGITSNGHYERFFGER